MIEEDEERCKFLSYSGCGFSELTSWRHNREAAVPDWSVTGLVTTQPAREGTAGGKVIKESDGG